MLFVRLSPAKVGVAKVFKSCAPTLPSTIDILEAKLPLSETLFVECSEPVTIKIH